MTDISPGNDAREPLPETGKIPSYLVASAVQLAASLGISRPTLSRIIKEPEAPTLEIDGQHFFNPATMAFFISANPGLIQKGNILHKYRLGRFQEKKLQGDREGESGEALERFRLARARQEEIKLKKEISKLILRSDAEEDELARLSSLKLRLLRIPQELSPRLENLTVQEIELEIKLKINEALESTSKEWQDADLSTIEIPLEVDDLEIDEPVIEKSEIDEI